LRLVLYRLVRRAVSLVLLDWAHAGAEITCLAFSVFVETAAVVVGLNQHLDWTGAALQARTLVGFAHRVVLGLLDELGPFLPNVCRHLRLHVSLICFVHNSNFNFVISAV